MSGNNYLLSIATRARDLSAVLFHGHLKASLLDIAEEYQRQSDEMTGAISHGRRKANLVATEGMATTPVTSSRWTTNLSTGC